MHIGFLTPEYPHPQIGSSGGLGTSIKNLATALISEGVQVTVFIYAQSEPTVFVEQGITFHLIASKNYRFAKWFFYRKNIQKYVNFIVKQDGIDLLEAPDWTGITAFMKFKVPLIIRFHGSDTYFCHLEKRKQKWKNRFFETLAVGTAQAYIAPTQYAGKVSSQLFGIKKKEVTTIPYGLNLTQFQNNTPSQYEKGLLLYIGTLIRKKGVFELPGIFNKVRETFPEARLVLIGGDSKDIQTGSTSTWDLVQQQFTKEAISQVSYLGVKSYDVVQDYIRNAHVCIFPTYAETLGMVTIESMAMQKPVVNSNIGWSQELMEDGVSGFLVHPANHNAYATKINTIFKDDSLVLAMGAEAKKFVENKFDIHLIVVENINFFKKILNANYTS